MNLEQEIRDLKRRVTEAETTISELKGSFEFLSRQLKDMHHYMIGEFDNVRTEMQEGFASLRTEIGGLRTEMRDEFKSVRAEIQSLRSEMPGIVADAVGEALRHFRPS